MAEVEVGPGVRVRAPQGVQVRAATRASLRGDGAEAAEAPETALQAGLRDAGFEIASTVELTPARPLRGEAGVRGAGEPVGVEVDVTAGQGAVLLVETASGVYAWDYPHKPVQRRAVEAPATLRFSFGPAPETRGFGWLRGPAIDWIAEKLIEPVRVHVLRFLAEAGVDAAVRKLEGDTPTGLVAITGTDAATWRPGAALALPAGRAARVLLMVHGTFSTTAGSFGTLTKTDAGRAFLHNAYDRYDAVLGFDHKTLAETPEANAAAMAQALAALPPGSTVDAVAYSRGGLVYRALAEETWASRPDLKLGKAVFLACTNGGTHLAEPENWAALVDLYVNLVMAGARAVTLLAGGGALDPLVGATVKTLGRFVQLLSEVAIEDGRVPGLAAMRPAPLGETVGRLNAATGGDDRLASYYALTSDFEPRFSPQAGLTRELADFLKDKVVDALFGDARNDLVVDTRMMAEFGARDPRLVGQFDFGTGEDVHHTIYFTDPRTTGRLQEWLLDEAPTRAARRPLAAADEEARP